MEQHIETKPLPKSSIVESEELMGQALFLYDDDSEIVYTLNSGAAMIWLLCDGSRDVRSIAKEIAVTDTLSEKEVLHHVQETVEQFQSFGLKPGGRIPWTGTTFSDSAT